MSLQEAEALAQGGELAGAGDAGQLMAAQIGQVVADVCPLDLGRCPYRQVALVEEGDELLGIGLIGENGGLRGASSSPWYSCSVVSRL